MCGAFCTGGASSVKGAPEAATQNFVKQMRSGSQAAIDPSLEFVLATGTTSTVYWEKSAGGGLGLCAVHCLNALLQGPFFSAGTLADIAHDLDRDEAQLLGEAASSSQNVDSGGNFSRQVLLRALQQHDLGLIDSSHPDVRVEVSEHPERETGYIYNVRRHWVALRRLRWGSQELWFNLDSSLYLCPKPFMASELPGVLANVAADAGTVLVVRGGFPTINQTELEDNQHRLGQAELVTLRHEQSALLDPSVINELLDLAKYGKWNDLLPRLASLEQSRTDRAGPCYVDALAPSRNFSLLHFAVHQGREHVVQQLLSRFSASLDVCTADGRSAEDLASQGRHLHILDLLQRRRKSQPPAQSQPATQSAPPVTPQATASSGKAFDLSVAHQLLDFGKNGEWEELFIALEEAEEGLAAGSERYVDAMPPPRRYGLVHFAAAQSNIEALRRLLHEFRASSRTLTSDGRTIEEVARDFNRQDVLLFLGGSRPRAF